MTAIAEQDGKVTYQMKCDVCSVVHTSWWQVARGNPLPTFAVEGMRFVDGLGNVCDQHEIKVLVDGTAVPAA